MSRMTARGLAQPSPAARLLPLLLPLLGCGATYLPVTLTPDGAQVKVSTDPPPPGCEELGPVSASHGTQCSAWNRTGTREGACRVMQNTAGARGANYVQIEREIQPDPPEDNCLYGVRGTAYFCEDPP